MKKQEKIIFLQDTKWGKKHGIKELSRGFIMNYLLPQNQVLFYNKKNLSWLAKQKAKEERKSLLLEEKAKEIYKKINNFVISFTLKKDEKGEVFGSVGFKEILQELEKSDFHLEKNQLLSFHPLNKIGENIIKIKLSNNLVADLKVIIK